MSRIFRSIRAFSIQPSVNHCAVRSRYVVIGRSFSTSNSDASETHNSSSATEQSTNQSIDQTINQSNNQANKQPINHSNDHSATSFSSSIAGIVSNDQSTSQSLNQSFSQPLEHGYTGDLAWSCRKCNHKHYDKVHCPCGETNKALQLRRKQHYQANVQSILSKRKDYRKSEAGKVTIKRGIVNTKLRRREMANHVRKQIAQHSLDQSIKQTINQIIDPTIKQPVHAVTCEWDGCTIPMKLLNVFRLDPKLDGIQIAEIPPHQELVTVDQSINQSTTQTISQMSPRQKLNVVDQHTVDGKVMLRCLCPVHQQIAMRQRRAEKRAAKSNNRTNNQSVNQPITPIKPKYLTWKQQKKLQLKHCTHDHCYHPGIPVCDLNTMDLFGLVHILDETTCLQLNVDERAKPVSIHPNAPKENKRKDVVVPELDKCRLMHLTCARDHRLRQLSMSLEKKKQKLRSDLLTLSMPDWYRYAIVDALDRHDAAVEIVVNSA